MKKPFLILIALSIFIVVACTGDDKNSPNPFEPEEETAMFPFLKMGNVFTYQCDIRVDCGTGYIGNIMTISIDSTTSTDSAIMYYGTNTFYERRINYYDYQNEYIDTVDVQIKSNVPLFLVKDSVVTFLFADSLKIPYDCKIGTIIDSMLNYDNERIYCKFDNIRDYSVSKQIGEDYNYDYILILYKNCFQSRTSFYKSHGNGMSSSSWKNFVYNSNYGLIVIDKGQETPVGPNGSSLSLIETNF